MGKEKFKVTCCIANKLFMTHLDSGLFDTPEQAKDFGDKLFESGVIVGYRVLYTRNGTDFFFHEYIRSANCNRSLVDSELATEEDIRNFLPILGSGLNYYKAD